MYGLIYSNQLFIQTGGGGVVVFVGNYDVYKYNNSRNFLFVQPSWSFFFASMEDDDDDDGIRTHSMY